MPVRKEVEDFIQDLSSTIVAERKRAIIELEKSGQTIAVGPLIKALKDKDRGVRALAARALGTLNAREAADALMDAIREGDPEVSYWAAKALGGLREKKIRDRIASFLADDSSIDENTFYWFVVALSYMGEESIPVLIELLGARNWNQRNTVAKFLKDFGEKAVDPLIVALSDENRDRRFWAARVLGEIGDSRAVPELVKLMEESSSDLRYAAVNALGAIGNSEAIETLKRSLKSPRKELRYRSIEALGRFGDQMLDSLIEALSDDYWYVRDSASTSLALLGSKAVPALLEAYRTGSEDTRIAAVKAMAQIGEGAVDGLLAALQDPYEPVCQKASQALVAVGPGVLPAVREFYSRADSRGKKWALFVLGTLVDEGSSEIVLDALKSQDPDIRLMAVKAVSKFDTKKSLPLLISMLADVNENIREETEEILASMQPAVPYLINALADENWVVRKNASNVLGRMGKRVVNDLLKALQGTNEDVRYWAIKALGRIGTEAITPLLSFLADKNWLVRKNTAEALVEVGPAVIKPLFEFVRMSNLSCDSDAFYWAEFVLAGLGKDAVIPLLTELNRPDERMRILAVGALGKMRQEREALVALMDAVQDEFFEVRKKAIQSLGEMGEREAVPTLLAAASGADTEVLHLIIKSLGKIGDAGAVSFLTGALEHENWIIRKSAVQALGKIRAPESAKALERLLTDPVEFVIEDVIWALGEIRARGSVSELAKLLDKPRWVLPVIRALGKIGTNECAELVLPYASSSSKSVRLAVAECLDRVGSSPGVIQTLSELMNDDYWDVRQAAGRALNRIDVMRTEGEPEGQNAGENVTGTGQEENVNVCGEPAEITAGEKTPSPENSAAGCFSGSSGTPGSGADIVTEESSRQEAEKYYKLGLYYSKKREYDRAFAAYQKALKLNPSHVAARCKLGLIYEEKGQLEKAIAEFNKAIEIQPDYINAHVYLGIVYGIMNRTQDAIREFSRVISLNPDSESAKMARNIIQQFKNRIS